jgi:hypothetical protein
MGYWHQNHLRSSEELVVAVRWGLEPGNLLGEWPVGQKGTLKGEDLPWSFTSSVWAGKYQGAEQGSTDS